MKKPLETARRWLAQAEHNLGMARILLQSGYWAGACFQAEQTAQLALKAYLYSRGRRYVNIHSVRELASQSSTEEAAFSPFVEYGMVLDRYYLATRYPDVLPDPALPFESFTEQESRQAVGYAMEIVESIRARIPADSSSAP